MKLSYKDNLFYFDCDITCNAMAKKAGFAYDRKLREWVTPYAHVAKKVSSFGCLETQVWLSKKEAIEKERELKSFSLFSKIDIPVPEGLAYMPFQLAGIEYLLDRPNNLLADEQGLGKSIESIGYYNVLDATLSDPKEHLNVLIICPALVKINWSREWYKWCVKKTSVGIAHSKFWPPTQVIILNYDILKKLTTQIHSKIWDLVILDEGHYFKNSDAERTKQIIGFRNKGDIKAKRKLVLTGTPILNVPYELFNILKFLAPYAFPNKHEFGLKYCDGQLGDRGWDYKGATNLVELQSKLRSTVMIRRLKEEVLPDLPPKRRQVLEIDPNNKCKGFIYKQNKFFKDIKDSILTDEEYEEIIKCLDGERIGFEEMSTIRRESAIASIPYAIEHLKECINQSGKIVCFAHHIKVIETLQEEFKDIAVSLHGSTPQGQRQKAIDSFQEDENIKLFIGNIRAAGVGITLTASSHVVFVEMAWTPAEVTQAEDRCHRIGQVNSLLVQHIVLAGSIQATMAKTVVFKQEKIRDTLDYVMDNTLKEALR